MSKEEYVESAVKKLCKSEYSNQYPKEKIMEETVKKLKKKNIGSHYIEYEKRYYRFKKFIKSCDDCYYIMWLSTNGLLKYIGKEEKQNLYGKTMVFINKKGMKFTLFYDGNEYCIPIHKMRKIYLYDNKRDISNASLYVYEIKQL